MIIDLKSIFVNDGSSKPIDYALDLSNEEYEGRFPLKKPVSIHGVISNRAGLVRFEAEISYEFLADCDRCGTETARVHTVRYDKSLATAIEGEDSDTILLVPGMKLDLDELVYSEVMMSLPMKHLCNAECKGICFKCGKNLNDGPCGCATKKVDPRLAALADFLD